MAAALAAFDAALRMTNGSGAAYLSASASAWMAKLTVHDVAPAACSVHMAMRWAEASRPPVGSEAVASCACAGHYQRCTVGCVAWRTQAVTGDRTDHAM